MGYMRHHAIVVTAFDDRIKDAHDKAISIIGNELVSEIIDSPVNGYRNFFVCSDGSKEFWSDSDEYEKRRLEFIKWIKDKYWYTWALIQYGDEEGDNTIVECS